MTITPQFLENLRSRVNLSSIIGKKVKLSKKGSRFVGICPFHTEKTPSFYVNDDEGFYHCFGCGVSGDAISYLRETDGLDFIESVRELVGIAGMTMPKAGPIDEFKQKRHTSLLSCLECAAKFFQGSMRENKNREAENYLENRGLSEQIIAEFRLGYAPPTGLYAHLKEKGFSEDISKLAGLTGVSERDGNKYDYFRDRVIFPIENRKGQVIAFGARTMGGSQPKYLNSPDSPSFSKKSVLYGWPQARERVRRNLPLLLVEGYMDVITVTASQKAAALAPLGTALTEEQISLVWKLHDEPILCFDGDKAGQRAADKAIERILPILEPSKSVRIATLPEGRDPDDIIKAEGGDGLLRIISAATSLLDATWFRKASLFDLNQPEQRAAFWQEIRNITRTIAHNQTRAAFGDEIERRIQSMRAFSRGANLSFNARMYPSIKRPKTGALKRSQTLLGLLISFPQITIEKMETLSELDFGNMDCEKMKNHLFDALIRNPDLDENGIRYHLSTVGYKDLLIQIDKLLAEPLLFNKKANLGMDEARQKIDEIIELSLTPRRR